MSSRTCSCLCLLCISLSTVMLKNFNWDDYCYTNIITLATEECEFEWRGTFAVFAHSELTFYLQYLTVWSTGVAELLSWLPHPALHSSLKVAMFFACALLQTTKSIMTPALWAQTWHADMISAEKHSADCVGACCYNLILVFRPFSQDRQIFWDVSFSFYSPKSLMWPAQERDVKHMNSRTKHR